MMTLVRTPLNTMQLILQETFGTGRGMTATVRSMRDSHVYFPGVYFSVFFGMFPSRSRKNPNGLLLCLLRFLSGFVERMTLRTVIGYVSWECGEYCQREPTYESAREVYHEPLGRAPREHHLPWNTASILPSPLF